MSTNSNKKNFAEENGLNNVAVIVGINKYKEFNTLKNAAKDAVDLANVLRDNYEYTVHLLTDATLNEINNFLDKKPEIENRKKNPEIENSKDKNNIKTCLLFYFAGHGRAEISDDNPKGFLIPQDAQKYDEKTWIEMAKVYQALAQFNCHHVLIILDTCNSGAFLWATEGRKATVVRPEFYKEHLQRYKDNPTQRIMYSAAYNQEASDGTENSPFTGALIEVLKNNIKATNKTDSASNGIITTTQLIGQIQGKLSKRCSQLPGGRALKNEFDANEFIFYNPKFDETNLENAPPINEDNNPYRGLQAFEKGDHELFFGRKKLIEDPKTGLLSKVRDCPLTVVLGASGLGKSSLVKAGLIPALEETSQEKWEILGTMRPGEYPLHALEEILSRQRSPSPTTSSYQEKEQVIYNIINGIKESNSNSKLLLVIDQAEELLTLCQNKEKRTNFIKFLAQLLKKYEELRIVLILRSEFEPQIREEIEASEFEPQITEEIKKNDWQSKRFIVTPMDREELQQAIEEPAAKRALFFESPKLVNYLIDEVIQMPAALPLFSFTLSELYLKKAKKTQITNDRTITQADYDAIGGLTNSLIKAANDTYENLVKEKVCESTIRHVMLRMVAISGGELARRRVPKTEFDYPEEKQKQVDEVIDRFVEARLLVKEVKDTENKEYVEPVKGKDTKNWDYVEPVHDALIMGWPKIKNWLDEKQDIVKQKQGSGWKPIRKLLPVSLGEVSLPLKENSSKSAGSKAEIQLKVNLPLQRDVTTAAVRWKNENKKSNFLWNASPFLDSLKLTLDSEKNNWFNKLETDFVQKSVEQKHRNIRLRWAIAIVVILGLSGLLGLSKINEAETRRESAEINLKTNQSLDGVFDSLEAGKILNNIGVQVLLPLTNRSLQEQVRGTLLRSVYTVRELDRLPEKKEDQGKGTVRADFSPDGRLLASAGEDGTVRVWDVLGQTSPYPPIKFDPLTIVRFNPNGKLLAAVGKDGTVSVWSVGRETLTILKKLDRKQGEIKSISFSQDGKLLAATGANGTVLVWNVNNLSEKPENPCTYSNFCNKHDFRSVAFSPDSKRLAITGDNDTILLWDREGKKWNKNIKYPFRIERKRKVDDEQKYVTSVRFSLDNNKLDNNKLVTAGTDGIVRVWDLSEQKLVKNPKLVENPTNQNKIWNVSFSSDGNKLATAGEDGTVRLWDFNQLTHGQQLELEKFEGHHGPVRSVSFGRDDRELASAGDDGTVRLWNLQGNESESYKVADASTDTQKVEIHDGNQSAYGNKNGTVEWQQPLLIKMDVAELWDAFVQFGTNFQSFQLPIHPASMQHPPIPMKSTHVGAVTSLAFRPDGNQLASGGEDGTIRLWDKEGNQQHLLSTYAPINYLAYSLDNKLLASAGNDGMVQLWNLQDGNKVELFAAWKAHHSSSLHGRHGVKKVSFGSTKDNVLVLITVGEDSTGSTTGLCKLWPIKSFDQLIKQADEKLNNRHLQKLDFGLGSKRVSVSFSGISNPETSYLEKNSQCNDTGTPVANPKSCVSQPKVTPLDPKAAKEICELKGHQGSVWSVAFSPNGQTLATSGDDGTIRLWNTKGQQIFPSKRNQTPIGSINFSPDGQIKKNPTPIRSINFSPDGQKLVSGDARGKIRLWDLKGKLLTEFVGSQKLIRSVKFNPNNEHQLASTGDDGTINLWDLREQSLVKKWLVKKWQADPKRVWDLEFSPNPQHPQQIASAEAGGSVGLWNLQGKSLHKFTGHINPVLSVAFSPDGKQLVSGCEVGMIRSWSLSDYQMTNMFQVNHAELNSVAYSLNGKLIVSGDNEGNIKMWKLNTQQPSPVWTAHQNSIITKVAFNPNGKMFATAADDGIVKLWQIK